eukprot:jgi/Mesen1/7247/ME000373S06317
MQRLALVLQQVAPKVVELNGSSAGETEASPDVKSEVTEEASQVEAAEDTAGTSASEAAAETEAAPEGAPEGGSSEEEKVADGTTEGEEGGDDLPLYPMPVKGPGGEEIELQVNPGDTVLDIRQFLADAPETCFYTCYDLIMTTADGIRYHLVDYIEIGDVTDIPAGGCSLEMYSGLYDDRAMRFHVRKARDLVSLAACYTSPSTILAAEYELAQAALLEKEGSSGGDEAAAAAARKKQQEEPKELPAELEQLGFVDNAAGLLPALAPKPILESSGCLESIAFSSFNPVPGYRRLQGDLMYFELTTVEGASFCLTGHTRGFFVNQSKGSILNPKPAEPKQEATTLVGLLRILSPKFVPAFAAVIEKKATLHPFENMSPAIPPNAWLGPHPLPEHTRDIARAEDALISPYGAEITGIQRDWNEELQSCRELPKATAQFIDAAVKGAKAVIGRAIPPINPPDPDRFHMWVHNGIFFSMAVDGDFVMLQQIREQELQQQAAAAAAAGGGEEAGKKGAAADKEVVAAKKAAEEEAQAEAEKKRAAEAEEEEKKKEEAAAAEKQKKGGGKKGKKGAKEAPTPAPAAKAKEEPAAPAATAAAAAVEEAAVPAEGEEAATGEGAKEEGAAGQVAESEQATYASANNDLKGTKLLNGADVPGLFTLAMTIVDYRGHRVIAQSIIPGILYGDKTASMMYGSVDNGKHIKSTDKFHSKVLEAGEMLHIKEHEVEDSEGAVAKICAPVEVKGIRGSDERQYLLDLMRLTPRDANFTGAGSRHCVVRPELVSSFCQIEEVERYMAAEGLTEQPEEEKLRELRENKALPQIRFNVNVLTDFKLKGDAQELEEDVALVKKVGDFLTEKAIPGLVADFRSLELSPMDGQTLTEAFHSRGINMRYLGKVAAAAKDLPHIYQLCLSEMVAVLRETMDQDVGGAIAHFFNCFLGTSTSVPPQTELGFSWAPAPVAAADAAGEKGAAAAADDAAKPAPEAPAGKAGKKGKGKKGGAAAQEKAAPAAVAADGEKKAEAGAAADATEAPASAEESAAAAAPAAPTPAADERPGYTRITADMVWSDITEGVKFKYQYELPADVRSAVRHLSTLRNACLKELEEDVALVKKVGDFLTEKAIPGLVADFRSLELSPMDGQTLTEAFHSRGINMRYLGKVAAAAKDLPHIYQLCLSEMVAVLRETMDQDVGGAIAHFFNCFLGTSTSVPPQTELGFSWAPAPVAAADAAGEKGAAAAADDAAKPAPEAPAGKAGKKGKGKKGGAAAQEKAAPAAVAADGEKKAEAGAAADATEAPASAEESAAAAAPAAPTPAADERPGYTRITADMVWSDITEGVKFKYQYELPADVRSAVRHLSTLRNACLKLGVVMAGRDYELEGETPFALADIQDMQPVVKHAAPVCADAQQLMTRGRRLMDEVGLPADTKPFGAPQMGQWLRQHQGKLNEAFEAFNEAFTLLQNLFLPACLPACFCCANECLRARVRQWSCMSATLTRVSSCCGYGCCCGVCRRLAMVLYHAGDPGSALLQEHRELIVNERILGPDHPHTAHSYGHMALFYHALSEPELSLRHLAKTLQLLGVTCGPRHPDTAATFINMAMTYQDAGKLPAALRYLQEALVCSEKLLGESHLQTAVCHHALALAFFSMGAFKLSLQQEKKAHAILEKQLGQGDARTRDSEQWMQTFVAREVQKQQSAQNASHQANAMRLVEALRGRPELLQALQQAGNNPEAVARVMAEAQRKEALHTAPGGAGAKQTAGGGGRGLPQATPGMRTRGVDERAAKATAEARRKAAARGSTT